MSWLPDWLTGFDRENYEAGVAADAQNAGLNRRLHERGRIDDATFEQVLDHDAADDINDPDAEIQYAFDEELGQRTGAVRDAASGGISAFMRATFGIVPWQVWLAGLAIAAVYFWPVLRAAFSKRR